MNQTTKTPLVGAAFMVAAGVSFAVINVIGQKVTSSADFGGFGYKSTTDAFWQYFIALLFSLPFIIDAGLRTMKTTRPGLHILRVVLAALGVQAFILGLSKGVPIWQVIALVMTSPFFILVALPVCWWCCSPGPRGSTPGRCCRFWRRHCGAVRR
jgi:S-adenosylmethionine uptake transporter